MNFKASFKSKGGGKLVCKRDVPSDLMIAFPASDQDLAFRECAIAACELKEAKAEIEAARALLAKIDGQKETKPCDATVEAVKADLDARTAKGLSEYGCTISDAKLTVRENLQHAYEEALDLAVYLKCAMRKIEGGEL